MNLALLFLFAFAQQASFEEIARRFENDRNQPDALVGSLSKSLGYRYVIRPIYVTVNGCDQLLKCMILAALIRRMQVLSAVKRRMKYAG